MTLGEKILSLRIEHHLSQGDLAEKMRVSRQSISKWETGASVPDIDKLIILSDMFSVSLDALVKNQEPEEREEVKENDFKTQEIPLKYPPRKIVGYILFGVGLLSIVLGLAVNLSLSFLGGYLLLCSIICLTFKNHPELMIGWGTFLPCAYLLPRITSANMGMIFHPYVYQGELPLSLIVSFSFWIVLFLLIFVTVNRTRMKKHPLLFCGWAVFSQIYGFIPIAFRHTEETMKSYLILSWCVILFLLVLLFFTGKSLYGYLKSSKERN